MNKYYSPVLLIDVGGTLIKARGGGTFSDLKRWFESNIGTMNERIYLDLARILLVNSNHVEEAFQLISDYLSLSIEQQNDLSTIMFEPRVQEEPRSETISFLTEVKSLGWTVCTVTNVSKWTPKLHSSLSNLINYNFESHKVGYVKQELLFWESIKNTLGIPPELCLVIGDSYNADFATPTRLGFPALLLKSDELTLSVISKELSRMGEYSTTYNGILVGTPTKWLGNYIVKTPYFINIMQRSTRKKLNVLNSNLKIKASIVKSKKFGIVVKFEDISLSNLVISWIQFQEDRRFLKIPIDLQSILKKEALTIEHLSKQDKRHLISLVLEAKNITVRRQRINNIIEYLKTKQNCDL